MFFDGGLWARARQPTLRNIWWRRSGRWGARPGGARPCSTDGQTVPRCSPSFPCGPTVWCARSFSGELSAGAEPRTGRLAGRWRHVGEPAQWGARIRSGLPCSGETRRVVARPVHSAQRGFMSAACCGDSTRAVRSSDVEPVCVCGELVNIPARCSSPSASSGCAGSPVSIHFTALDVGTTWVSARRTEPPRGPCLARPLSSLGTVGGSFVDTSDNTLVRLAGAASSVRTRLPLLELTGAAGMFSWKAALRPCVRLPGEEDLF